MTIVELSSKLEAACLLVGPYGRFTIEAKSEPLFGVQPTEFRLALDASDMQIVIAALRKARGLV